MLQWNWNINDDLRLQTGYQLLYAQDLNELKLLHDGPKFRRDPVTPCKHKIKTFRLFWIIRP